MTSKIKVDQIENTDGSGDVAFTGTNGIKLDTIKSSGGTTGLTIDSSGVVTTPAKPAFIATIGGSNNQTGITGSSSNPTTIIFTTAPTNIGGHYNTTTGKFTAPVAGAYFFCFNLLLYNVDATDDNIHIAMINRFASGSAPELRYFSRTPGESANGYVGYNGYLPWGGSIMFQMAVNDTVEMAVGSTGTIDVYGNESQCRFSGFLIG